MYTAYANTKLRRFCKMMKHIDNRSQMENTGRMQTSVAWFNYKEYDNNEELNGEHGATIHSIHHITVRQVNFSKLGESASSYSD